MKIVTININNIDFLMLSIIIITVLLSLVIILLYKLVRSKYLIKDLKKNLALDKEISEMNNYRETTNNIYDNVLEADITNNRLIGDNSQDLIAALGLKSTATYSDCIDAVLAQIVKEEFVDIYKNNYSCEVLLNKHKQGEKMFSFEFIERADLKNYYWTKATVCTYYSKATKSVRIISYIKNIQSEKDEQLRLNHLAYNDSLTEVLNIGGFINTMNTKLDKDNNDVALFIIDLDNFKQINDVFGHHKGDQVLYNSAKILKDQFSDDDVIGRLGGDEFVVLVKNYKDIEDLKTKAQCVCDSLIKSYKNEDMCVEISASIGIAISQFNNECFNKLYKSADIELYKAKKNGKNQYSISI